MYYLIVTQDKKLAEMAKKSGACVFTAHEMGEAVIPKLTTEPKREYSLAHNLLSKLNIRPNIKGYQYIEYLIARFQEDPNYHKKSIIKEVYPECAEMFGTTGSRVERAIRHALVISFNAVPEKYHEIFGGQFMKTPTNSQFISMLSEYINN